MRNISRAEIKECEDIPVSERGAPRAGPGDWRFQCEVGIIKLAGGSQAYEGAETEHPQGVSPTMRAKGSHRFQAIYSTRWSSGQLNWWRLGILAVHLYTVQAERRHVAGLEPSHHKTRQHAGAP